MGMFDEFPNGAQVKCWWNCLRVVKRGDEVPPLGDPPCNRYQIALREGGFAQIRRNRFVFISKARRHVPMFDKYGEEIDMVPAGYLLEDWENDPMLTAMRQQLMAETGGEK